MPPSLLQSQPPILRLPTYSPQTLHKHSGDASVIHHGNSYRGPKQRSLSMSSSSSSVEHQQQQQQQLQQHSTTVSPLGTVSRPHRLDASLSFHAGSADSAAQHALFSPGPPLSAASSSSAGPLPLCISPDDSPSLLPHSAARAYPLPISSIGSASPRGSMDRVAASGTTSAAASTDYAVLLGLPVKYWALIILVVQNSSLVLLMRYTRTVAGPMYIASTAVFFMELIKLATCVQLLFISKGRSMDKLMWTLRREIMGDPRETLKMMVPSALYAVQNNLLFVALTNLDVATFQITYQVKILTTALFSVAMLGRSLTNIKWFSLLLLVIGVALVQLQSSSSPPAPPPQPSTAAKTPMQNSQLRGETNHDDEMLLKIPSADDALGADELDDIFAQQASGKDSVDGAPPSLLSPPRRKSVVALDLEPPPSVEKVLVTQPVATAAKESALPRATVTKQSSFLGLLAVALACMSSGFAGVYFERMLKRSNADLWVRNIQLGLFGTLFSLVGMLMNDGAQISQHGLLHGYNFLAWLVVLNQAIGGLIVAIVVKYADNILKGFATSVSIIVSGVLSAILFDFRPTMQFTVGATVVIFAVYLYGKPDAHIKK